MISLSKYVLSIIYKIKKCPNVDLDFWDDITYNDIEEELENV